MTASDRSFPSVLARTWHAAWMQTTGAVLPAVKKCSLPLMWLPAQDRRSAPGLLNLTAVQNDGHEQ